MIHRRIYPDSQNKNRECYEQSVLKKGKTRYQSQETIDTEEDIFANNKISEEDIFANNKISEEDIYANNKISGEDIFANNKISEEDIFANNKISEEDIYMQIIKYLHQMTRVAQY